MYEIFKKEQFRVLTDDRNEKVGYKIRDNELHKIPYMLVIGDREVESGQLPVRRRLKGDLGQMSIERFLNMVRDERRQRK